MALINPPSWMQAGSYPARSDRLVITSLLSYPGFLVDEATPMRIRQGVKPSYTNQQLKVRAAPTPNMTVIVSGGFAFIDQHDAGGQGTYVCANDGDVTLTIQPAGGAGQYRRDCVVASVYDAETAGAVSEWRLEVIQGAYAATAGTTVRPTLPPNAQLLADVTLGPSQTAVSAASILDVRSYSVAAGGVLPVTSAATPNRLHPGQVLYLTDTDRFVYGTASGVTKPLVGEWVSYTPTLTNVTLGNGSVIGEYCQQGDIVDVSCLLTFGSTTVLTSTPGFSPPVSPKNANMRWNGDVLISPPGTFRTGKSWLYYNSTSIAAGAVNPSNGGVGDLASAGINIAAGGWLSMNIRYRAA